MLSYNTPAYLLELLWLIVTTSICLCLNCYHVELQHPCISAWAVMTYSHDIHLSLFELLSCWVTTPLHICLSCYGLVTTFPLSLFELLPISHYISISILNSCRWMTTSQSSHLSYVSSDDVSSSYLRAVLSAFVTKCLASRQSQWRVSTGPISRPLKYSFLVTGLALISRRLSLQVSPLNNGPAQRL